MKARGGQQGREQRRGGGEGAQGDTTRRAEHHVWRKKHGRRKEGMG
jgi:hypothetical protein